MKRYKQTKTQKKRNTGQLGSKRMSDGHWEVIYANKHGSWLNNRPLEQLQRWVRRDTMRQLYVKNKRMPVIASVWYVDRYKAIRDSLGLFW